MRNCDQFITFDCFESGQVQRQRQGTPQGLDRNQCLKKSIEYITVLVQNRVIERVEFRIHKLQILAPPLVRQPSVLRFSTTLAYLGTLPCTLVKQLILYNSERTQKKKRSNIKPLYVHCIVSTNLTSVLSFEPQIVW